MAPQIFDIRSGINTCYVIREKGAIMVDGGPPRMRKTGARMVYPGHGKPFPVDAIRKFLE